MKRLMIAVLMVIATIVSAKAQYGNQAYDDDRYYYDNDFDWHWDIRVKISNGIQRGLLTRNESNRLYNRLEDVERKEYVYQADGLFSGWEQQEIWDDVVYLNQRLGVELNDYDRNFYGFDVHGYDRRGYSRWFYQGGYDFNRFDKRGFGNVRIGYAPRPNYNGWCRNNNNYVARNYYLERNNYRNGNNRRNNERVVINNRPNSYPDRLDRNSDSRYNNDYSRNGNGRNSSNNNGNNRIGNPSNRSKNNVDGRPERVEPNRNGGYSQGNSGGRPERVEPNNPSDNGNRGGGNNRSEVPQSGGNGGGGSRGPR